MSKQRFCFLQVSDNLINPVDVNNPADVYFKAIWNHLDGKGYFKPDHYWEIPTWIAELSYCLYDRLHEKQLFHIEEICPNDCGAKTPHYPVLPDADIYFASVMDCNKEILSIIVHNNPDKIFCFGGYVGQEDFWDMFGDCFNVTYHISILALCIRLDFKYQYGTDYSLFNGTKCIPRLILSNGCTNHCRFCTVPDEITVTDVSNIWQQFESMKDLDFELVYINDKTFGQCFNYYYLKRIYHLIKEFNPRFRGFTIQTTCYQILKFYGQGVNLKDLGIVNVEIGVESYSDDILKKYNKPQNTETIDMALNILKDMGVNIIPNIIIGLPGETWQTYTNTDCWLSENKHKFLMLNVTNFAPYVGSDDINTIKRDFNENSTNRSYHTEEETKASKMFSDEIFKIGMEIIENTKARPV